MRDTYLVSCSLRGTPLKPASSTSTRTSVTASSRTWHAPIVHNSEQASCCELYLSALSLLSSLEPVQRKGKQYIQCNVPVTAATFLHFGSKSNKRTQDTFNNAHYFQLIIKRERERDRERVNLLILPDYSKLSHLIFVRVKIIIKLLPSYS